MRESQQQADTPFELRRPLAVSGAAALVFLVVCTGYIVLSDRWVARIAGGTDMQMRLQTLKGTTFVVLSALLIFGLAWGLLRRLARNHRALIAHQEALVKMERRAAVGLLATSVAHDMNNVLTVGMANLELLRNHTALDAAGTEMLTDIGQSLDRLHDMTRRMSQSNHGQPQGVAQPVDLAGLLARSLRFLKHDPRVKNCDVRFAGPEHRTATVHEYSIREALENLVLNAAEATRGEGAIEVRLSEIPGGLSVDVHDSGPGVPPERRQQIFEPLYTTKPNGLGLGLVSVRTTAKLHKGRVEVDASPLGGACFRLILSAS